MRLSLALFITLAPLTQAAEVVGTASRTVTLSPDEVVIQLVIETPTDTTIEQSLAAVASLGLTQKNLESVGMLRDANNRLAWQYSYIRPYSALYDALRQIDYTRRELTRTNIPLSYQFYFRPALKSVDAARQRVLSELITEARRNSSARGELRSVIMEPSPQTINAGRLPPVFGQASGLLQYEWSVVAVFDAEPAK